jgi:hypothetical protein
MIFIVIHVPQKEVEKKVNKEVKKIAPANRNAEANASTKLNGNRGYKPSAGPKVNSFHNQKNLQKAKSLKKPIPHEKEEEEKIVFKPKIAEKVKYEVVKDKRTQEPDFIREDIAISEEVKDAFDSATDGVDITIKLNLRGDEEEIKINKLANVKQLKEDI